MFEQEYKDTFSKVTASRETYRRVMHMAKKEKTKHRGSGFISKVPIVAVMVALLVVSVSASETVRSWFASYFVKDAEVPMSTEQEVYFEENEQSFDQSITVDGVTMELKSAITDGKMAYICLGVTAPEAVTLSETTIAGYSKDKPTLLTESWATDFLTDQNGNVFFGYSSIESVEDYDGRSNTQNLVIKLLDDEQNGVSTAFGSDIVWNMHFKNLIAKYVNASYYDELMNGKYENQENFFFTEEESKQLYPEVILAEGDWNFEIRFESPDVKETELIQTPVSARVCMGWNDKGENVYENVDITSFVLRSFSAELRTNDETFAPDFTSEEDIFVVMKDGTKVRLLSEGGAPGEQDFRAELPILLDEVDYVLLPNSTKIVQN